MNIYLAGNAGPDQVATKWLMQQRGYAFVVCESDILRSDYIYNRGMRPCPREFKRFRTQEVVQADVVVLGEGMSAAERVQMIAICRYGGVRVMEYAQLPVEAPGIMREEEVLDALALPELPIPKPLAARLLALAERMATAFDRRFGWFFTNGMKTARAQQYAMPDTKPTTTA